MSRRRFLGLGTALGGSALISAVDAPARAGQRPDPGRRAAWPTTLHLPDGFHPGGMTIGAEPSAFFGSLLGAAIYRVDLATGEGRTIYPGVDPGSFDPQHMAVGMQADHLGRLFVAGGWGGLIRVHDAATGDILRTYQVGSGDTAVYAPVVTRWGAWFTDGLKAVLYGLPFGRHGELPDQDDVITRPLVGDWVQEAGPTASGIVWSPDHRSLLVVDFADDGGTLFRVDPSTGLARAVDLGGYRLPTTLGLVRDGSMLYATPQQGGVAALALDPAGTRGVLVRQITDPRFDVPAAGAVHRRRLYLVNSRFPLAPTPTTPYNAVSVDLT